uniref:Uncharacterized protein n=1 Tax=Anopheles farauti TaxID=69004 RepID=A0A182Q488_9DIPT
MLRARKTIIIIIIIIFITTINILSVFCGLACAAPTHDNDDDEDRRESTRGSEAGCTRCCILSATRCGVLTDLRALASHSSKHNCDPYQPCATHINYHREFIAPPTGRHWLVLVALEPAVVWVWPQVVVTTMMMMLKPSPCVFWSGQKGAVHWLAGESGGWIDLIVTIADDYRQQRNIRLMPKESTSLRESGLSRPGDINIAVWLTMVARVSIRTLRTNVVLRASVVNASTAGLTVGREIVGRNLQRAGTSSAIVHLSNGRITVVPRQTTFTYTASVSGISNIPNTKWLVSLSFVGTICSLIARFVTVQPCIVW